MSTIANNNRLQLKIDVLTLPEQEALALPELTPPELIDAILQEFQEIEYLSQERGAYTLYKVQGGARQPLDKQAALQAQVSNGAHLVLAEVERPQPLNTRPAPQVAYVRDMTHGRVFRLDWLPAIIGRPDPSRSMNQHVAVNLQAFEYGLRVSRRHAQITAVGEQFYIENLANNPTRVNDKALHGRVPLNHGDHIWLERSNITLKFILQEPPERDVVEEHEDNEEQS